MDLSGTIKQLKWSDSRIGSFQTLGKLKYQAYVEKMVVEEKIIEKPERTDAESIKVFV